MSLLQLKHICKSFSGVYANENINLSVEKGEIHALLGENGAGKTTLVNIIFGLYTADSGEILWKGKPADFASPKEAIEAGVGMVQQHFSLVNKMTVLDNIILNLKGNSFFLDRAAARKKLTDLAEKYGLHVNPDALISDLSVGEQQRVEILKALYRNVELLILDEPTGVLTPQETTHFFEVLRNLKNEGYGIIIITHRMSEIMAISDKVTILRDGKYVADADVKDIELSWIVENMVGKNTQYHRFERSIDLSKQPKVLEIKDMCLPKKGGGWTLDHVSLDLKKGEVLGVYGLLGAGRSELFECLMGLHPEHTGDVLYEGKKLNIKDVAAQIKNGFALVPEDRQSQGLIQTLDIGKNTAISSMKDYVKGLFLDEKAENAAVDEQIKDIHIKVADKRLPILSLSGGNQQKVVIGKGLLTKPKILLLDEPSRGIDIGAKTEVFEIIHDLAEKGLSIIVISSELKEIMAIADRIVVLSNGKKTGELTGDEITEDTLVRTSYAGLGTGRNA